MAKASQLFAAEIQRQRITQRAASLAEEMHETAGGAVLDAETLRCLRGFFLLLNEWDRAMRDAESQNSPKGMRNRH